MPFYLFARASGAWTPRPVFFPDDAFYARLCLPHGLSVYWHDFRLYRILTILPYALVNRTLMRAGLSPAPLALGVVLLATLAFVRACVSAGLSRRRGALLAGVLLGSPVLLETVNFWSGTLNYALVLLLSAAQLAACARLRRVAPQKPAGDAPEGLTKGLTMRGASKEFTTRDAKKGLLLTACGALLCLLTYEIALPFVLATSAFYARGWIRRAASVCVAVVVALAFVAALAFAGLYWPERFKLAARGLAYGVSEMPTDAGASNKESVGAEDADSAANENSTARANVDSTTRAGGDPAAEATRGTETRADAGQARVFAAPRASSVSERARMYVSLLFSFIGTGLSSSPSFWALAVALFGLCFLSRGARVGASVEGRLPQSVVACAFGFAFVACAGYLALTKSMNARYAAFLLIYAAASLAWTKGRVAAPALASLVLLQAAAAAALPVHMRDVELASKGEAAASFDGGGDLISVNGRLARASWGKRFLAPPQTDALTRPLNPRACRYARPCEECK